MINQEKSKKIIDEYSGEGVFRYGLKISSPFEDEFRLVAKKDAEIVEVRPQSVEILENDMKKSRLLIVHVHEGAIFEYIESADGQAKAKSDIHIFLLGPNARAKIVARYNLSGAAKLDILHKIYHQAPDTVSIIDARGVINDDTYLIYRSNIKMEKRMNGLSGAENGKFLVLSKTAKVDAIPSLDIASKNVSCSHSLSITHITQEDLFYSETRGIGENEARKLLIGGFLN